MSRQNRPTPPAPSAASARQNEYFVPRDGIDREVITADICRYLGNDALVRPGTYEQNDGRVTQGYYITAYRNLTSAMIQDLKANSARWEQERRTSRPSGPGGGASQRPDQYRNSETHHQRAYYAAEQPIYEEAMTLDLPYAAPAANHRYPGTGNAGYDGVNIAQPQPGAYAPQARYDGSAVYPAVSAPFAASSQPQYPATHQAVDMYSGLPSGVPPGLPATGYPQRLPPVQAQDPGQYVSGINYRPQEPVTNSPMPRGDGYQTTMAGYPAADYSPAYQPVGAAASYAQPIDVFFGRGNQPQSGYSPAPEQQLQQKQQQQQQQQVQYEPPQSSVRPSAQPPGPQAQGKNSPVAAPARRDRDREQDRHRESRERERDRDRERDREGDRHAADRHSHRHRTRP